MTVRPARLNAAIAWLFMVGSACFVLGSVPAWVSAVGGWADGVTYFVGSIFFTSASACQLVQAQSPSTTGVDARMQHVPTRVRLLGWLPHERNWLAAATQFPNLVFVGPKFEAANCAAFSGGGPHLTTAGNTAVAKMISAYFVNLQ